MPRSSIPTPRLSASQQSCKILPIATSAKLPLTTLSSGRRPTPDANSVPPIYPMTAVASDSYDAETTVGFSPANLIPAAFASNPHIVPPTRADFAPPVPLHHRRVQPTFPQSALPRSIDAPSVEVPLKDPFSQDSYHGAFSTSLKGTRALLRKRGRRAEVFVGNVDNQLRAWLGGSGWTFAEPSPEPSWSVIDNEMVEVDATAQLSSDPASRRMPAQHQVRGKVPPLPIVDDRVAAIVELSRSPAHITWAVAEGFERLIVHLLARYYELVSWSE